MEVYKYSILVEKMDNKSDTEILDLIKNDIYLKIGGMTEDLKSRGCKIYEHDVYLSNAYEFPEFMLKDNTIVFDVYVPSIYNEDHSLIENAIVNGSHSGGYKTIATKDPVVIYFHE